MEYYVHNIDPDLFTLGPISIRFYGLVYFFGFLVTMFYLKKVAKKGKIKNLDEEKAMDLVTSCVLWGVIGARIFHCILEIDYYIKKPLAIFYFWNGGMAFFGGLVAGGIAGFLFCKKHKISFLRAADKTILLLPLIIFFGRLANFINSEHYGYPSTLPFAVIFPLIDNIPRHPAQLYEGLSMLLLFIILLIIDKKTKKKGKVIWSFVFFYGILRFITEFFRYNSQILLGLSFMQYVCIMSIVYGAFKLWGKKR